MYDFFHSQAGKTVQNISFERCLEKDDNHSEIETIIHQAFLDDDSPQDCQTAVAMILESLRIYKRQVPEVEKCWIKADNAT